MFCKCQSRQSLSFFSGNKNIKSLCRSFVHDDASTLSLQLGAKSTVMADLVLDEANLSGATEEGGKIDVLVQRGQVL